VEHGNVMLGFDAEERADQQNCRKICREIVWGSRTRITTRRALGCNGAVPMPECAEALIAR